MCSTVGIPAFKKQLVRIYGPDLQKGMQTINQSLDSWLSRFDPDGSRYLFYVICKNWERIVGPEISALAKPMGRSKATLILGAEDSMVIQEISFLSTQILGRINAFCGSPFFDKTRVELLKGRIPLDRKLVHEPDLKTSLKRPERIGGLMGMAEEGSAVARCYARYVEFMKRNRDEAPGIKYIDSK